MAQLIQVVTVGEVGGGEVMEGWRLEGSVAKTAPTKAKTLSLSEDPDQTGTINIKENNSNII